MDMRRDTLKPTRTSWKPQGQAGLFLCFLQAWRNRLEVQADQEETPVLFTVEMCTHLAQDLEKLMKEILQFWTASGGAAGPGSAPYPEEWPADQQQYTRAATMPDTIYPIYPQKNNDHSSISTF